MSTAELRRLGVAGAAIGRRVAQGQLRRLHDGVFLVGVVLTRPGRLRAAVLACGPNAVLSHRTAAELWNLLRPRGAIHVTTPTRRKNPAEVQVPRSRALTLTDVTVVDALPVTSLARTLLDLAETEPAHVVDRAIHEAEFHDLFDLNAVDEVLARANGRTGAPRHTAALAAYRPRNRVRSETEERFRVLCTQAGLPAPQINALVDVGDRRTEVDAFWPQHRLAVEIDGGPAHATTRARRRDPRRDTALTLAGFTTLRFTDDDAWTASAYVISALRRAIKTLPSPPP